MLTNRYALLEYDVGGPVVVHERLILDHVAESDYIVCTPDRDIYCETMDVTNEDLRSFRLRPAPGRLPPGVAAGQVYALPNWSAAELSAIRADATREAQAEKARRNVGGAAPVVQAPVGVGVAAGSSGEDKGQGPGARGLTAGTLVWVAAESDHGFGFGDQVQGVVSPLVEGAKTLHDIGGGSLLFCICIDGGKTEDFNGRISACDGRLLPRKINAVGTPERPLAEAGATMKEYDMGWKLNGPRTSRWCLNYLCVEAIGFEAHHERFRQLCKLDSTAWGVMEHFQLSMVLRQLIQVDLLNGFNHLGIELMFRRLQTIEYGHSEKAREVEARSIGGKLSLEEQFTFGSLVRQAGTLMIAPDLLDHVKVEVQKEAELQKNLRKAREERDLAKKNKKKGEEHP